MAQNSVKQLGAHKILWSSGVVEKKSVRWALDIRAKLARAERIRWELYSRLF